MFDPDQEIELELPKPTKYQEDAIFHPCRGVVIEATTKAGKTIGCLWWLLDQASKSGNYGRSYWWVAPIYEQAEIAFRRCKGIWLGVDPERRWWTPNESKLTIAMCNGATIRFKGADKPDSLYGDDVYGAVLDEATRVKEEAWHALRTTLTATRAPVRIIGNVKGRHNWAYQLARRVEKGDLPDWHWAKITCYDAVQAGIISHDEVEAARRELPESVFKELYEGVPSDDGSNPFGLTHIAACVRAVEGVAEPAAWGVDLAKSVDWTVALALDDAGRTVAVERWQHTPWDQTVQRLTALIGDTPALADSTGVGDPVVESIQKHCPLVEPFKFTSQSKQQLMEGLAVAIQQRQVTFPDGPIRQELETFEYEATRTGVRYTAPEGHHDDCVMALALAVRKLGARRPLELVGNWGRPRAKVDGQEITRTVYTNGQSLADRRADPEWGWGR